MKHYLLTTLLILPLCQAFARPNIVCKVSESPVGFESSEVKNIQRLNLNRQQRIFRTEPLFQYGFKVLKSISVYASSKQNSLTMTVHFQNDAFKTVRTSVKLYESAYLHIQENDMNLLASCRAVIQGQSHKTQHAPKKKSRPQKLKESEQVEKSTKTKLSKIKSETSEEKSTEKPLDSGNNSTSQALPSISTESSEVTLPSAPI